MTKVAAYNGDFEMLRWLRAQGCPWNTVSCIYAAEAGHLKVLRWLRSSKKPGGKCPWSADVCAYAAENGHLKVLRWARAQNPPCPWDDYTFENAVHEGQRAVLRWLTDYFLLCITRGIPVFWGVRDALLHRDPPALAPTSPPQRRDGESCGLASRHDSARVYGQAQGARQGGA